MFNDLVFPTLREVSDLCFLLHFRFCYLLILFWSNNL